jgi:hypothetical protein
MMPTGSVDGEAVTGGIGKRYIKADYSLHTTELRFIKILARFFAKIEVGFAKTVPHPAFQLAHAKGNPHSSTVADSV